MRIAGTLVKWNDSRGFGFIAPNDGSAHVFVHISVFPRDGARPVLGELLHFGIEDGSDGKKRAVNLVRPGRDVPSGKTNRKPQSKPRRGNFFAVGLFVLFAVLAYGGYRQFSRGHIAPSNIAPEINLAAPERVTSTYRCDGRTTCSQMTSCEEATYFLQHCPTVKMDGDGDGIPCEQQWCSR